MLTDWNGVWNPCPRALSETIAVIRVNSKWWLIASVIPVEAGERLTKKLVSETTKEGPAGTGGSEAVEKLKTVTTQELPQGELPNYQIGQSPEL